MIELKQSSVALLEEAIDRKIRNAQRGRDTTLATVTRVDSDGTTWVRVYGGAEETPVRRMTSSAQVGDTINVVFSGLSCMGVGNVTNPSASVVQVESVEVAARGAALAAQTAWAHADDAAVAAQTAWSHADEAADAASSANRSANSALTQLSIVEDVAGTLDWISKHGQYVATTDTTVVADKVYFEKDGDDYTPVVSPDPSANPRTEGWYVLDVTDSQSDFIMAHLAVTGRGLWVLPSGIGSATDEQHAAGYKVLLSSDGMYVYDSTGALVIKYGQNIEPSTDRPFYIGDPNSTSYILFTPASGGNPAHISIGGGVTIGSDKTLSELLTADDITVTQNPTQTGYDVDIAGNTFSLVNGSQGPAGTSVTVSKVEYATSTSESQPSSGWSTTAPSTVAEGSWLWVKTTYSDGTDSVIRAKQGKSGTNGTSYYTHVRYSESADGTGHVATPTSATKYIGVYTGTSSSAPSSKTSYKWSKYVGEDGAAGHSPAITTSHSGTTTTIYADGTAIGTVEDGDDGTTPTITASKSGGTTTVKVDGTTIATINDGTSVTVSKIEYGTSSSASTSPSSWSTTVPTSITKGKWLWVKTTYSDNSTATTKSYVGTDGEDGKSVAIRSATKADGVTTVVLEETDGTTTTTKTLTIADGQDGSSGQPGANGYVHTAWANSADGATDFSTTVSTGKKYLGVYTDNTEADSTSPGAYSWSLIKGETGATAQWYYGTALTHTSGTATLATSSTAGVVVGAMYLNTATSLCYRCTAISGTTATWTYAGNLTDGVIDNIGVGGRNLLRNTAISRTGKATQYGAWDILKPTYSNPYLLDLDEGEYVLSFDWEADSALPGSFYVWIGYGNAAGTGSAEMPDSRGGDRFGNGETSGHVVRKFTWPDANDTYPYFACRPFRDNTSNVLSGITFTITNAKLERGNVATDWAPAPEDFEAAIEEAAAVAGNYIVETASNDVWIHSEGHGPNSSGVATSDTYGWRIGSVFELVRAGVTYIKMWVENSVAKLRLGLETSGHVLLDSTGMEVKNASASLAKFGNDVRLGTTGGYNMELDGDDGYIALKNGSKRIVSLTKYVNTDDGGVLKLGDNTGVFGSGGDDSTYIACSLTSGNSGVSDSRASNVYAGMSAETKTKFNSFRVYAEGLASLTCGLNVYGALDVRGELQLRADSSNFVGIKTKTANYTGTPIRVYGASDANGDALVMGLGGMTVLGGGESASSLYSALGLAPGNETLHLASDNEVNLYAACQTVTNRTRLQLGVGTGDHVGAPAVRTDAAANSKVAIGTSSNNGVSVNTNLFTHYSYDKNGFWTSCYVNRADASGGVWTVIGVQNKKTDGTNVANYFNIVQRKDGSRGYSITDPAAFRSALGLDTWTTVAAANWVTLASGWTADTITVQYNAALGVVRAYMYIKASAAQTAGNKTLGTVAATYRPKSLSVTLPSLTASSHACYITGSGSLQANISAVASGGALYFCGDYFIGA